MSKERILICGVNWIGDTIMSMPAIQALRSKYPDAHIAMMVKPALRSVWELHGVPDEIVLLESGVSGLGTSISELKKGQFSTAYILPHSFRSALGPFAARIPRRVGMPGHSRDWMLTDIHPPRLGKEREHQVFEYYDLLMPEDAVATYEAPRMNLPDTVCESVKEKIPELARECLCLLPGAARGPSKRWPEEHFVEAGRMLSEQQDMPVLVSGAPSEIEACERIATGIGARAVNVSGRTNLHEWIGLIALSDLVVCNDSGGMHIAAAVDTPLVAVFGMTDPMKTGPLTERCRILQHSAERSRDIGRDSREARDSLASVQPDEVVKAGMELLNHG